MLCCIYMYYTHSRCLYAPSFLGAALCVVTWCYLLHMRDMPCTIPYCTILYYSRCIVLYLSIHYICTVCTFMPTTWYEHFAVVDDHYYFIYITLCYNYYSRIIIIFYFRLYYHEILYSYHIISINTSLHLKYRFESYCWILRFKIFLNRSNLRDFLLRYK